MKKGRDKYGNILCEHNRRHSYCVECSGKYICRHNKVKAACKKCIGSQICRHGKTFSQCKICGGGAICQHSRIRSHCKECGGFPTLAKMMRINARTRAKKDGLPFNISTQDILNVIGDGVCPALGVLYNLSSRRIVDESATLDRLIPRLGYVKGNIAVISHLANRIKNNSKAEQILRVGKWLRRRENTAKKNKVLA